MKLPYIFIVALVALFANVGCSVEGNPGGGGDAVGAIQSNLTYTTMSGTWDVIGTVRIDCATSPPSPGGCDGQGPVWSSSTPGQTEILFPDMNLGGYMLSFEGAALNELLTACYSTDAACLATAAASGDPYCIYTGTRLELVGCSYTGHSPSPVPVLAGTTNTATMHFDFHFSDGVENTLFTGGTVRVVLQTDNETVCGESTSPCPMGQLCASLDVGMPSPADLACYSVCYVPMPLDVVPAGGPWGPWTSPCPAPNTCVHAAGLGFTGMFNLGLCMPPTP